MAYIFKKLADNWETLTVSEKEALFMGTDYLNASVSQLVDLDKPFKIATYSNDSHIPSVHLKAVSNDKLFIPNSLFGGTFETIDNIKPTVNVSGGKVKFAITKDLSNYFTFDASSIVQTQTTETSGFVLLDPFTVENVILNGIDATTLENISEQQWDIFFNGAEGDAGLGIAFAISQDTANQQVTVDDITMYVDMKGEWRSAHKGEDFEYGYPNNNLLRVQLLTDGDYKINYQNMVGGM